MSLDLYRSELSDTPRAGAASPPIGLSDGFWSAWQENQRFVSTAAQERLRAEILSERVTQLREVTGEQFPELDLTKGFAHELVRRADEALPRIQARHPDTVLPSLAAADIEQEVIRRAGQVRRDRLRAEDAPHGWGGSIGFMLGDLAGAVTDPINLATLPLGAGVGAGIARTVVTEFAANALSQAAVEAGTGIFKSRADPNYRVTDAFGNIASAGVGGALIGGGAKGLASLWSHYLREIPDVAADVPRDVQDAGNVVTREAIGEAANPYRAAVADGIVAHRENLEAVQEALAKNDPIDLAADAGDYRPGTVFAPRDDVEQLDQAVVHRGTSPARVFDADNRALDVRYEVVEADELVTSNLDDFSINPAYPAELQPRDRTRAASQDQVTNIAANLEPERLGRSVDAATGAPIIDGNDVVESGNGRVLAIRRAYRDNADRAAAYRSFLGTQGFDIAGFDKPVLVARRTSRLSPQDRAAFATSANRATAMRLAPAEQAIADAQLISDRLLGLIERGEPTSAANRPFIRAFADSLPASERGPLFDAEGVLSQEGARRVSAGLLARAYGDPRLLTRLLEDADSNMRAIGGALTDAAGPWAAMRGAAFRKEIPAGMDITEDVLGAFRTVARARDERRPLRELVDQAEMFDRPSPVTRALLGFMFRDGDLSKPAGRSAMREALESYADIAMTNEAGPRLFGEALPPGDVLATAFRSVGREDLVSLAEKALPPGSSDTLMVDRAVDDAVLADADRLRAGPDAPPQTMVPLDGADGSTITRSLDEIIAEADEEQLVAQQIRACALGSAAETAGEVA